MTRTRKWWLGTGGALGALVVALAVLLVWLLYTAAGLRFALNRGVAVTNGQFAYTHASGTLAGITTLTGLRYRDASGDVLGIQRATLDLQPWALLSRRLHVRRARIDGVNLALPASSPPEKSGTFSLQPPLTIVLDDVQLTRIAAVPRPRSTGAWTARITPAASPRPPTASWRTSAQS